MSIVFQSMKRLGFILFCFPWLMLACRPVATPKPYGYFRIAIPDTAYSLYRPAGYPYAFMLSLNAKVKPHPSPGDRYWIDIVYPDLNATIHCSYKPVRHNLNILTRDAERFIYDHAGIASSIPEQDFTHPEARVYGVYYELHGNTASPVQFFLTDSTCHFFRASLYCNTLPNQDSLAPVYDYMRLDMRRMVESFYWQSYP